MHIPVPNILCKHASTVNIRNMFLISASDGLPQKSPTMCDHKNAHPSTHSKAKLSGLDKFIVAAILTSAMPTVAKIGRLECRTLQLEVTVELTWYRQRAWSLCNFLHQETVRPTQNLLSWIHNSWSVRCYLP